MMPSDELTFPVNCDSSSTAVAAQTDELEPGSEIYFTSTLGVAYWVRVIEMQNVGPTAIQWKLCNKLIPNETEQSKAIIGGISDSGRTVLCRKSRKFNFAQLIRNT